MTAPERRYKDAIYGEFARIGKAVGSPRRLELLGLLSQGPRTVEVLARQSGQSVANTSHHLGVLRTARLVDSEKNGLFVTYRLAGADVEGLLLALRRVGETRLAEIERVTHQFLEDRGALEPIDTDALVERVRAGTATVIDVRPEAEFRAGHIPGAVSMPLAELEQRLTELSRDAEIVAYCRGPYCVMSLDAVELLRSHGLQAIRMDDGVVEWRARGWMADASEASP